MELSRCFGRALLTEIRPNPRIAHIARICAVLAMVAATVQMCRASNDCLTAAAQFQRLDPALLRAIAYQESGMDPTRVNHNSDGSEDIGLMQINSVHLKELATFGITRARLFDPCVNAYVGAWYLRKKINQHGYTWKAVGAYHSETSFLSDEYERRIRSILDRWGLPID